MLQTFCYLCIKKPLTLPHTPLRILKHRTKNTYEPPKERTTKRTTRRTNRRTNHEKNHEKNDQKHEQKHEPRKERPKERTQKNEPLKARPKSTSQKHKPSPNVSSPPHSPGVCKPAYQSHKAQQAPLIASLRPKRNPPLIVAMCRR